MRLTSTDAPRQLHEFHPGFASAVICRDRAHRRRAVPPMGSAEAPLPVVVTIRSVHRAYDRFEARGDDRRIDSYAP